MPEKLTTSIRPTIELLDTILRVLVDEGKAILIDLLHTVEVYVNVALLLYELVLRMCQGRK